MLKTRKLTEEEIAFLDSHIQEVEHPNYCEELDEPEDRIFRATLVDGYSIGGIIGDDTGPCWMWCYGYGPLPEGQPSKILFNSPEETDEMLRVRILLTEIGEIHVLNAGIHEARQALVEAFSMQPKAWGESIDE